MKTIRSKILVSLAVALVGLVGIPTVGVFQLGELKAELFRLSKYYAVAAEAAPMKVLAATPLDVEGLYAMRDQELPRAEAALRAKYVRIGRHLKLAADHMELAAESSHDEETQRQVDRIVEALQSVADREQAHRVALDGVFAAIASENADALSQATEHVEVSRRALEGSIESLARFTSFAIGRATGAAEARARGTLISLIVLTAVAIAFALGATTVVGRALTPIRELVEHVRGIGSGDFSGEVLVASGRGDEVETLAQEFNQMVARLNQREKALLRSERLAAIGQMSSQITHEVRNPLNSFSLNLELLEDELREFAQADTAEAWRVLKTLRSEVDRLTEVTETYLRFARLPNPKLQKENLTVLIESLLSFLKEELASKAIQLDVRIDPGLNAVRVDQNQIRQAILNLIRNAVEAMGRGGKLRVEAANVDGQVQVRIVDSGPGIGAEALSHIFDPFYSTKDTGTGLGLPLTQQIIEEHGGTISCDSIIGQGTTFTLRMPAA